MAQSAVALGTYNPLDLLQGSAPSAPAAGFTRLYADASGDLHQLTPSSVDTDFVTAGGAAMTLGSMMAMGF